MGKYLDSLTKLSKAEAIRNPWGLARYLAEKYRGVPGEIPYKELKAPQKKRINEFMGAVGNPGTQNRTGKANRVTVETEGVDQRTGKKVKARAHTQGQGRGTPKGVKASTGSKQYKRHQQTQDPAKKAAKEAATAKANKKQIAAWRKKQAAKDEEKSLDVQKFLDFMADDDIPALNKMISEIDDSPEGLFMQAVRKAMGKHSDQYKDIGKPQFLKKAAKPKPLQKVSNQLAAFLAGLAIDTFDDVGQMTPSQQREWERMVNRQMKRKSLKDGVTMEDLQKHWSDSSDTYVRRVPVANGVRADETFLNKKLSSPPRPGEVWNPVSHRWTKDGNLGQVNVGSGGRKRLRAGSSSAGAHQRSVGGLSGKGRLRFIGTGRVHRGATDIAEQAQGTKAGVGSGKSPTSRFRTGAKAGITGGKPKAGSFQSTPTRKRKKPPKHTRLDVTNRKKR